MTAKEILDIVRGAIRPYLAFIFPTVVVIIGGTAAFILLKMAVNYIDRDIALVIITSILGIVTSVSTATVAILAFYFGERAGKKKEEK
jgi:hypothetical protein